MRLTCNWLNQIVIKSQGDFVLHIYRFKGLDGNKKIRKKTSYCWTTVSNKHPDTRTEREFWLLSSRSPDILLCKTTEIKLNMEKMNLLGATFELSIQNMLILVCLFIILIQMAARTLKDRTLPPGPYGFPVVGVLPYLRNKPYLTIQTWWQRYGDVFSLYMGQR